MCNFIVYYLLKSHNLYFLQMCSSELTQFIRNQEYFTLILLHVKLVQFARFAIKEALKFIAGTPEHF